MARVCIIGLWHLGCVTAACIARRHQVICLCRDKGELASLSASRLPILEPGLEDEWRKGIESGNLSFTSNPKEAVQSADAVWITFDTPVDSKDRADTRPIEKAVSKISPLLSKNQLVLISSQLPIGTSRKLLEKIPSALGLSYTPENLRLGTAIDAFLKQERIVFGLSDESLKPKIEEVFSGIEGERLYMSLESAEMSKHALNSYLATLISFSGEISDLCEKTGANAIQVMEALQKERRVSPDAPLSPGLGFGGGTLARDMQALRKAGKKEGCKTPVLDGAFNANKERTSYVRKRLEGALGSLEGKSLSFFGLTYKPGTDTLRRSLALDIISGLDGSGAKINAYDPAIKAQVQTHPNLQVCKSAEEAAQGSDAIIITTGWEEFKSLDFERLAGLMRNPLIIDARNILAGKKLPEKIKYLGVGVGSGK